MSLVRRTLARAEPLDLVFMGYVAFSGALILFFGWQLDGLLWVWLTAAHVVLLVISGWWARRPRRHPSLSGFFRDVYPYLFIAFLYWELRYLALLFADGYHDPLILRLEEAAFGEQLAMTLSQRLPALWLSELMHFFYGIYWVLLPLAALALFFRGKIEGFRELAFVELVVFFGCYLVFIFFPVAGPHYVFPVIGGELGQCLAHRGPLCESRCRVLTTVSPKPVQRQPCEAAPASKVVRSQIMGDAIQPSPTSRFSVFAQLQPGQRPIGTQERLLGQVLGHRSVRDHPVQVVEDRRLVVGNQLQIHPFPGRAAGRASCLSVCHAFNTTEFGSL